MSKVPETFEELPKDYDWDRLIRPSVVHFEFHILACPWCGNTSLAKTGVIFGCCATIDASGFLVAPWISGIHGGKDKNGPFSMCSWEGPVQEMIVIPMSPQRHRGASGWIPDDFLHRDSIQQLYGIRKRLQESDPSSPTLARVNEIIEERWQRYLDSKSRREAAE